MPIASGAGATVTDADGRTYIDLVCSWGAGIVGHAHPLVVDAVSRAASRGLSFGATTEGEIELAEEIRARYAPAERVRLVSTGTEATMTALRLARAATGRDVIIKFAGCYHGHSDSLLVAAGSGLATAGTPDSAGVTKAVAADTMVLPYGDEAALTDAFAEHGATDRRRDHGGGPREHGCRRAAARLQPADRDAVPQRGRRDDLRRGADGLPRRSRRLLGRRAGRVVRGGRGAVGSRPRDVRQGHRRRAAGGRGRRASGPDGAARAPRAACIRRARCPGIRSRWRRALPRCP